MSGKSKPSAGSPAARAEPFKRMTAEELLEGLEEDYRQTLQIEEAAEEMEDQLLAAFEDAGGGDAGVAAMETMRRKMAN